MDEMLAKIVVQLFSTLAPAIRELKQGRSSQSHFRSRATLLISQRLDRLAQDEARTPAAETLKVVYSLIQNMTKVMSSEQIHLLASHPLRGLNKLPS
jgi:hypothetical protein